MKRTSRSERNVTGPDQESARGLVQLEGYLLWSAEIADARRHAVRFTEQLPWLTTAQREDVERVYAADRLAVSRAILVRISERITELRSEYSTRYHQLATRCVTTAALTVVAVCVVCVALTFSGR